MDINSAYSILELPSSSSKDEVKKKFKQLIKKWHPDVNKSPEAEDKFKKITQAYERIINPSSREQNTHEPFRRNMYNPFISFNEQQEIEASPVSLETKISFAESIMGCKREIKFNRQIKCSDCQGHGKKRVNNNCEKCGGAGIITNQQGNMIFSRTCDKCKGKVDAVSCSSCQEEGVATTECTVNVNIPGGIQNNNILRLSNMGNYFGSFGPLDQYTDAFLKLIVESDDELTLENETVVYKLPLTLLDAIRGCKKTVKTVVGNKEIEIKPLSKNKDEVIIPHVGINGTGPQKVVFEVSYPSNVNNLIDVLQEK